MLGSGNPEPPGHDAGRARRATVRAPAWVQVLFLVASGVAATGVALPPPPRSPLAERPVAEAEWAQRLIETLALERGLAEAPGDGERFALLCPERPSRRDEDGPASPPAVVPVEVLAPGPPVRARARVPAGTLYVLVVEGEGRQRWSVGPSPAGAVDPSPLRMDVAPKLLPLRRGEHLLEAEIEPGARVESARLVPYTSVCIRPGDGWRPDRALDFGAKARTLVQALGLEGRLPVEDDSLLVEGEAFDEARGPVEVTEAGVGSPASAGRWAAAPAGAVALDYRVALPEAGVYSVIARVHGSARQLWSLGEGPPLPVHPGDRGAHAESFVWTEIVTQALPGGEISLRARVPEGSGVDAVRLLRRRSTDQDYVDVLTGAGLAEGPAAATVSDAAASSNLSSTLVRGAAAGFVDRLGPPAGWPLGDVESQLRRLYTRPLSPFLPPEL